MNIQEIDKWLDNEYGVSYTRLEELHDFVIKQDLKHREEAEKEIERLNKLISQREKKWEKWTTEKTILSTKMSDYLCKYQNLKREYTKQIKISTDRKKEIERLNKENEVLKKIQCTFLGTGCKEEIERLNNIINAIEKGTKDRIGELEEYGGMETAIHEDKEILKFIQELKGDGKE